MKKRTLRTSAVLLLLAGTLAACAAEAPAVKAEPDTTADAASSETAASTDEVRLTVTPMNTDYDGHEFRIISFDNEQQHGWTGIPSDIDTEEETGEVLNDAVYYRNLAVEEALNITITNEPETADKVLSKVTKSVMSNSGDYDLVVPQLLSWQKFLSGQLLYDLNTLEGLDLSKPWWDPNMTETLTFHGRLLGAVSDVTYIDKLSCWTVFFNKEMAEQYDLGNLYELVRDGKWTFDQLMTFSQNVSADIDGNGSYDEKDRYGIASQTDIIYLTMHSAGTSICEGENDTIVYSLENEKTLKTAATAIELLKNKQLFFDRIPYNMTINDAISMMIDNRALFMIRPLQTVMNLRSMKADFGIIPMPKYEESQDRYYTPLNVWSSTVLTVPRDTQDTVRTTDVLNLLACESYYTVIEPFYDLVLDSKLVRDEETASMLDIAFDSRFYDIGLICNFASIWETVNKQDSNTLASAVESNRAKVMKEAEKFIANILDYEE